MKSRKLPHIDSIEELARFWDTHDLTEFEDEFEVVSDVRFVRAGARAAKRAITVRLEEDTLAALTREARKTGVGPSTLARMWIREHLGRSGGRDSAAGGS